MSGDQIKGLRDLQRANMGDITDIASQLLARQLIALGARGEPPPPLPPPPPPKKERVRRCSPTSKATLQPWKADCVPAHMLPAARKKTPKTLAPSSASPVPASSRRTGRSRRAPELRDNWESSKFNCRQAWLRPSRRSARTTRRFVMHTDDVVQRLSEMPFIQDVKWWGVLTIGTGLGNARFTNRGHGKN
ncbi:hypothetical protein ACVWXQ_001173 [Bradyrhizobium sp. S3.14.4]